MTQLLAANCGNTTWDFGLGTYLFHWKNGEGKTIFAFSYYELFLCLGIVITLLVLFDRLAKKIGLTPKANRFYTLLALVTVAFGLFSATLFQSVYNWIESGEFAFKGMTFMGGLIGGAAVFLIGLHWIGGKDMKAEFWKIGEIAPACIALAHGIGRIGCFFGCCCYGAQTDAWYGVVFPGVKPYGIARVPTQLFEAAFLFLLCAFLIWHLFRGKRNALSIYCMAYGLWRFVLEFFRDDPRGALIAGLTPSQFWCMLMFLLGVAMFLLGILRDRKPTLKKILPLLFEPELVSSELNDDDLELDIDELSASELIDEGLPEDIETLPQSDEGEHKE